jgi:hypothetical protein
MDKEKLRSNYEKAVEAADGAWATERGAMGAIALAILALVDELRAMGDSSGSRPSSHSS